MNVLSIMEAVVTTVSILLVVTTAHVILDTTFLVMERLVMVC